MSMNPNYMANPPRQGEQNTPSTYLERLSWDSVPANMPILAQTDFDQNTVSVVDPNGLHELLATNDLTPCAIVNDHVSDMEFWVVRPATAVVTMKYYNQLNLRKPPHVKQNLYKTPYMIVHPATFKATAGEAGFLGVKGLNADEINQAKMPDQFMVGETTRVRADNPKVGQRFGPSAKSANFEVAESVSPEGRRYLRIIHHSDQPVDITFLAPAPWKAPVDSKAVASEEAVPVWPVYEPTPAKGWLGGIAAKAAKLIRL